MERHGGMADAAYAPWRLGPSAVGRTRRFSGAGSRPIAEAVLIAPVFGALDMCG